MDENKDRKVRSYVLRGGRMSTLQRRAIEELGDTYVIPFNDEIIDPSSLFEGKDVVVEIGFGMGIATIEIAEKNRDLGFIGIEVHPPGVGKVLSEIEKRDIDNLRIIQHDAVEVFRYMIPESSLKGIHVFFPDPWPKKKHHKRRLINGEFSQVLAKALKPCGYIHAATDWEEYAAVILNTFRSVEMLRNKYNEYAESTHRRRVTKFEMKGREKEHVIRDVYFERI